MDSYIIPIPKQLTQYHFLKMLMTKIMKNHGRMDLSCIIIQMQYILLIRIYFPT